VSISAVLQGLALWLRSHACTARHILPSILVQNGADILAICTRIAQSHPMERFDEVWRRRARILALLLAGCVLQLAHADPLSIANEVRRHECGAKRAMALLEVDPQITAVAERWARGGRLSQSIPPGYGEVQFVSLHLSGVRSNDALARALRREFCDSLANPAFTRLGVYRRSNEYWFVLASASSSLRAENANAVRAAALRLVNEARSRSRRCGTRKFAAAPALQLNAKLNLAAEVHARNMARHRRLEHEGLDGSTPGDRARTAGYAWRAVAENIAAGPTTATEVVQMWLDSPGHCANIMSPDYTEMGLAFAEDRETQSGVYWAQAFGRPR
jgi:uncharacterized protein YkwD